MWFFKKKKSLAETNKEECKPVENLSVSANSAKESASNGIIMQIDSFIEDEKGQIGTNGIFNGSLAVGDMVCVVGKNGEAIDKNVPVNEIITDSGDSIDSVNEACFGEWGCIMFFSEVGIKAWEKLLKKEGSLSIVKGEFLSIVGL